AAASAPDRLDVEGADGGVVGQARHEAGRAARRDLLRRGIDLGLGEPDALVVERLDRHLDVAALARAGVEHRGLDVQLGAVVAPPLADRPDLEARRAGGGELGLGDRRLRGLGRLRRGRRLGAAGGARAREGERREPTSRQGTTSAAALDSTASPRSVLAVSTIFPGAICHMSVVIVSPGKTTPEKRTSNDFMRAGSPRQYAFSTARPAWPKLQRPCRIGRS